MCKTIDREKEKYATHMLELDVRLWWNLTLKTMKSIDITWVDFKKLFKAKYKTIDMTYIKAQEFINITYKTSIVKEYSIRFNFLA